MQNLWYRIKKYKACYLYILPFTVLFFTFTVLPVILSMVLSFTNYNIFNFPDFTGFDNYIKMFFGDSIFLKALINTLTIALVTGPIGYIASFLLAWMINN